MGEGAGADVRLVGVGHEVHHLVDVVRDLGEPGELLVGDHVDAHLQLEVGDNAHQIGVAALIAVAVDAALHLRRALLQGGQAVGDGQVGVVVGVDAQRDRHRLSGSAHGLHQLRRDRAAVRVAEDDAVDAGGGGRLQALERIVRVREVAVEVVLGVEEDGAALGL